MNFPNGAPVTPAKLADLRARVQRLGVDLAAIEETFVKGGGKGGQKINKTANAVRLSYIGFHVKVQRERSRELNRFLALRQLLDKIEGVRR
jgi:protein subunit release factor B